MLFTLFDICEVNPLVTGGFPLQRDSNVELWYFLWCLSEQAVKQTDEWPVIWDAMTLRWLNCTRMKLQWNLISYTFKIKSYCYNATALGWLYSIEILFFYKTFMCLQYNPLYVADLEIIKFLQLYSFTVFSERCPIVVTSLRLLMWIKSSLKAVTRIVQEMALLTS